MPRLRSGLFAALLCLAASSAFADTAYVCADEPGDVLILRVAFSADYETAVSVVERSTGQRIAAFNNYAGRGAGGRPAGVLEWRADRGRCLAIIGQHKKDRPNPSLPWVESRMRMGNGVIGFEDSADNDFNDATVEVIAERRGRYMPQISR